MAVVLSVLSTLFPSIMEENIFITDIRGIIQNAIATDFIQVENETLLSCTELNVSSLNILPTTIVVSKRTTSGSTKITL